MRDVIDLVDAILDQDAFYKIYKQCGNDEQAKNMLTSSLDAIYENIAVKDGTIDALFRLVSLAKQDDHPDGWVRNQVFKAANELKIKLPSGAF